jgi:hypothetical protein
MTSQPCRPNPHSARAAFIAAIDLLGRSVRRACWRRLRGGCRSRASTADARYPPPDSEPRHLARNCAENGIMSRRSLAQPRLNGLLRTRSLVITSSQSCGHDCRVIETSLVFGLGLGVRFSPNKRATSTSSCKPNSACAREYASIIRFCRRQARLPLAGMRIAYASEGDTGVARSHLGLGRSPGDTYG